MSVDAYTTTTITIYTNDGYCTVRSFLAKKIRPDKI